jgi:dihydroorotate dehydrogenase (fumarate)
MRKNRILIRLTDPDSIPETLRRLKKMADVTTTYMGIPLQNPILVGACELTAHMGTIQKIAEAGAGALVIKSLFEEQVQLEQFKLQEALERDAGRHAEMTSLFPKMQYAGPKEHLLWVKKAKEAVKIPVFASVNAVNRGTWVEYAKQLQDTGVDGLELNFFEVPRDPQLEGTVIEQEQFAITAEIVKAVKIPVSVKLSPFYANPLNVIARLDQVGVRGVVLFNRLFHPDIDVETETLQHPLNLSQRIDYRLPLRYAGLLYGQIKADVCSSTGIFDGNDVIKMLLAGAQGVQVVSALYFYKTDYLHTLLLALQAWMDAKGYATLADFRGKLSKQKINDPWAYERAQYVKLLFETEEIISRAPMA